MGNALCPLSVAPRTLSVAPTDSAHAPSHPLSVACLPKETRHPAACCVPRTAALSSALSAPLSALRSQRCALSAALSSSRSPPLPAMTTTYAPRAARVCLPALNLSQRTYSYAPCACGLAASVCLVCGLAAAASPLYLSPSVRPCRCGLALLRCCRRVPATCRSYIASLA